MLEMVVYAERVPKVSKGNMWKDNEVLRFVLLFYVPRFSKQRNEATQHNDLVRS